MCPNLPHSKRQDARTKLRTMAELLDADSLRDAVAVLDGWEGGPEAIVRTVGLRSFPIAIQVVDRVAEIAEEMDHHPDIDIRWRTLTFRCVTHSAGGVTTRDIALANRIDRILADASA
jgi:4a-hydroxytetrahydrobiopterin dehydratase